jgi:PAS domain S-box-containing protein
VKIAFSQFSLALFYNALLLEERMQKANQSLIEVGRGMAQGTDAYFVGSEAARQALVSIRIHAVSAVMVFAAANYNLDEVSQGVHSIVREAPVFGATTAGEICGSIYHGTVYVVILASPYLRVHCGVGANATNDWRGALDEAMNAPTVRPFFYDNEFRAGIQHQGRDCFIMLFVPGITEHGEYYGFEILEALKEKSGGDFPVIGGGATDDRLEQNQVLLAGRAYPDGLLVVVFETELQFGIALTHGFQSTDQRAIVTTVDGNEVLTIDGERAIDVYSRLVDVSKSEMQGCHPAHVDGATLGISDPMGQHTVNLVDSVTPRGGIRLSRPVCAGTMLTRMNPAQTSLVKAGAEGFQRAVIRGDIADIALGLVFYCSFRPTLLGDSVKQDFLGMQEVLSGKPLAGFCCCGEIGVAADGVSRFNTSSVACLVLGGQLSRIARITHQYNEVLAKLRKQSDILALTNEDLRKEVEERKKSEAALRESENKLKNFAGAVPDISMIIDEDGRYIEVFGSGYQKLRRPNEDLNGKMLHERFHPEFAAAILKQIQLTVTLGTPQCKIYEIKIGEEKRFFEGRTAPMSFKANGKNTVAAVAIDITEQWKAERMLKFAYELRRKSDFFNDLITGNIVVDTQVTATAKIFGIDLSIPLFCCLLTIEFDEITPQLDADLTNIQMLNNILELLSADSTYLVWDCREGIAVLYQTRRDADQDENEKQIILQLQEKLSSYEARLTVKIGVSNWHVGNDSIREAYREARSASMAMRCHSDTRERISWFRDIGIVQLLTNMDEQKQAREFITEKIGKIIDYDRKKGTNLLDTLEAILQSNNLKEAAGKLYIHYKTIAFRKQRIEKVLGVVLDDYETRLALATALKLYQLSVIP